MNTNILFFFYNRLIRGLLFRLETCCCSSEVSIILYLIDYQLYKFCKFARVTNVQQKSEKTISPVFNTIVIEC